MCQEELARPKKLNKAELAGLAYIQNSINQAQQQLEQLVQSRREMLIDLALDPEKSWQFDDLGFASEMDLTAMPLRGLS